MQKYGDIILDFSYFKIEEAQNYKIENSEVGMWQCNVLIAWCGTSQDNIFSRLFCNSWDVEKNENIKCW